MVASSVVFSVASTQSGEADSKPVNMSAARVVFIFESSVRGGCTALEERRTGRCAVADEWLYPIYCGSWPAGDGGLLAMRW
ncbi:hypothetical protein D3C87_1879190 [compost metagenome]